MAKMNREVLKQRYLRDDVPVQISGIAANLARGGSFIRNVKNRDVVMGLLDESKYFVDWCAPRTDIDKAARLVELQRQRAAWQFSLDKIWPDQNQRLSVGDASLKWSDEILAMTS